MSGFDRPAGERCQQRALEGERWLGDGVKDRLGVPKKRFLEILSPTLEKHTSRLRKIAGTAANALSVTDLNLGVVDIILRRVFRNLYRPFFLRE